MFWTILIASLAIGYLWQRSYTDWQTRSKQRERQREHHGENGPGKFVYMSLTSHDSMRLLQVMPAKLNEPVQITMTEHKSPTSYRCLSYMWGTESDTHRILVNGQSIGVRKNLYEFLRVAAEKFTDQPLWIDAICINQNDNSEKAHQVQRMGDIYREAEEVFIWLGGDKSLLKLIRWIDAGKWKAPKPKTLETLKKFVFHPYWQRSWITQEVMLAKSARILHAFGETDWKFIGPMVRALVEQGNPDAVHSIRTSHPVMLWNWQADQRNIPKSQDSAYGSQNLFWVIFTRRVMSKCYRPCDRIYSLLALMEGDPKLRVDYEESPVHLFWRAGEHLCAWSKFNHIRALAGALDLDHYMLRRSLASYSNQSITIPVRQSYVASPLRTHWTGVMVCQNGHYEHSFQCPRKSRQAILLCPNVGARIYDDSNYTHALVEPIPDTDSFTVMISRQVTFQKNQALESSQCELCHFVSGQWTPITSWSYLQNNMVPQQPGKQPVKWRLRMSMEWVVYCVKEDRSSGGWIQLPTIESEQFARDQSKGRLGGKHLRHKLSSYLSDKKTSTTAVVS